MENRTWNLIDSRVFATGGNWKDVESSIQAKTFGVLLELAQDKLNAYKSDLYHDAIFIKENLTEPKSFDWVVRDWGTFIGNIATGLDLKVWEGSVRYRLDIYKDDYDGNWMMDIYEDHPLITEVVEVSYPDTADSENPTLRNESITIRNGKENINMDNLIRELREKLDDANGVRDDAYSHRNDLDEAIGELDDYVEQIENLVSSLEDLPSVSVDLDMSLSFES